MGGTDNERWIAQECQASPGLSFLLIAFINLYIYVCIFVPFYYFHYYYYYYYYLSICLSLFQSMTMQAPANYIHVPSLCKETGGAVILPMVTQ